MPADDIQAIAPDGTTHVFPGGTDPAIVDGAMKRYITGASAAPAQPNLVTGAGMMDLSQKQAQARSTAFAPISPSSTPEQKAAQSPAGRAAQIDAMAGGNTIDALSRAPAALSVAGSIAAPEFAPEIKGVGGILTRAVASGLGAGLGNSAGQVVEGENPLTLPNLKDSGRVAAVSGALDLPGETLGALSTAKVGRAAINESMGATARDVTFGNPAKALTREGINTPFTGDIEKYKDALRAGANPTDAAQAAGGRFAAVNGKINELSPKLDSMLSKSNATISAKDTVLDPIDNAIKSIRANHGVTATDADAAIKELNEMRDAAIKTANVGNVSSWAPLEANQVKREIGQQVNWMGRERTGQLVDPVRKEIYGSLKNEITKAVPESSELNERLTNLLAASGDLQNLSKAEEVGRGAGVMRGTIGTSMMGRLESSAGRVLPAMSRFAPKITRATAPLLSNELNSQ